MTRLGDAERALVGRSVASLRRAGWPAGRALGLVAERLEGGARAELQAVAAALARGERPAAGDDPLLRLLAQGDAAGADAFDEAVRGFELSARAGGAAAAGIGFAGTVAALFLVLVSVLGFAVVPAFEQLYEGLGSALPLPTAAALSILSGARWLAPVLLAATLAGWAMVLRRGVRPRLLPGVAGFEAASRLRVLAAALRAGLAEADAVALVDPSRPAAPFGSLLRSPKGGATQSKAFPARSARPGIGPRIAGADSWASLALRLAPRERALATRLAAASGLAAAARSLAMEREAAAARAQALFARLAPLAALVALAAVVGVLVAAFYLPLFSIAGSIS